MFVVDATNSATPHIPSESYLRLTVWHSRSVIAPTRAGARTPTRAHTSSARAFTMQRVVNTLRRAPKEHKVGASTACCARVRCAGAEQAPRLCCCLCCRRAGQEEGQGRQLHPRARGAARRREQDPRRANARGGGGDAAV